MNKEDHMVVAHRLGEMEKRRVGTRFIEREATEEDQAKPLMEILSEKGFTWLRKKLLAYQFFSCYFRPSGFIAFSPS